MYGNLLLEATLNGILRDQAAGSWSEQTGVDWVDGPLGESLYMVYITYYRQFGPRVTVSKSQAEVKKHKYFSSQNGPAIET